MTALVRRVAHLLPGIALAAALAGCGSSVPPSASHSTSSGSPGPSLTPVPGAPSPTAATTLPPTSVPESNPGIGPIWNALPPSWPSLPGQSESEIGTDATSMLVVKGPPAALANQLRSALAGRGWTVDVGSPLEDGTVVLDATHAPAGCRLQARFSPDQLGANDGTLLVYYGAACPFD